MEDKNNDCLDLVYEGKCESISIDKVNFAGMDLRVGVCKNIFITHCTIDEISLDSKKVDLCKFHRSNLNGLNVDGQKIGTFLFEGNTDIEGDSDSELKISYKLKSTDHIEISDMDIKLLEFIECEAGQFDLYNHEKPCSIESIKFSHFMSDGVYIRNSSFGKMHLGSSDLKSMVVTSSKIEEITFDHIDTQNLLINNELPEEKADGIWYHREHSNFESVYSVLHNRFCVHKPSFYSRSK